MPDDSVAVSIHLTVPDIDEAMRLYAQAFGFKPKFKLPGPGGRTMHGEMVYNGCTIMLGPEAVQRGMKSPLSLGGSPVNMFVYVDNVDALCEQAKAAGVNVMLAPNDQFFGCRTCVLRDPAGHQWMFAQYQRAVSPDEMLQTVEARHKAAESKDTHI
ncbi:MAG: VOC family protein [Candidatus Xenobia bacterium]